MPPLSPDDCLEARGLPRRDAKIAVTHTMMFYLRQWNASLSVLKQ